MNSTSTLTTTTEAFVVKRDGRHEPIDRNKIGQRLSRLKTDVEKVLGRKLDVSIVRITQNTIKQIYNGITTSELDEAAADVASGITDDPDYGDFAGSILASNLEANNRDTMSFAKYAAKAYHAVEERTGAPCPLISKEVYDLAQTHGDLIDQRMVMARNLTYGHFAIQTMAKGGYLLGEHRTVRRNKTTVRHYVPFETPQHHLMRVALGIHSNNLDAAFELYDTLSCKKGTMATPTLFFAGTPRPQCSSCFLAQIRDDSLSGIFDSVKDCAMISKDAGGIGLHVHNVRSTGSHIKGTNGTSNGLVPMLRVFNNVAKYVDQCFHPDTLLYTAQGSKRIAEVEPNDRVVTQDGSMQRVLKVLHHPYDGPVFRVSTQHSHDMVTVTPSHPLFGFPDPGSDMAYDVLCRKLQQRQLVPEFTEVSRLHVGDWVGYPIPTFSEDVPSLSEHDCRLLGIMIGAGDIDPRGSEHTVRLHPERQQPAAEFVRAHLQQLLIEPTVLPCGPGGKYDRLCWVQPPHVKFPFTREMLCDASHVKRVPQFAWHLPEPKLRAVVQGLLETGCASPTDDDDDDVLVWQSRAVSVCQALRYMLMRLGVLTTTTTTLPSSSSGESSSSQLHVPKVGVVTELLTLTPSTSGRRPEFFAWNHMLFSRITHMSSSHHRGMMVDFHIEHQHNYVTPLGLARNGGGRRAGSFAIYLEPWHADILEFLDLKKPHGAEDQRARDLFYALWTPKLFFRRIRQGLDTLWSLMDPKQCPGLSDVYGDAFDELYTRYEREGKFVKQVPIRELVFRILESMIETGTPYILAKDACNAKSNQKNLGTIKSSNLCVAGDTLLLTREHGEVPIQTVVNRTVSVWNGKQWSEVRVLQTHPAAPICRVWLNNGTYLDCTPYHKFFVGPPDPVTALGQVVTAAELQPGDPLTPYELPTDKGVVYRDHLLVVQVDRSFTHLVPTYCFHEPLRHAGVFNGVLTGNCTEVVEFSSPEETAVCTLASLSLPAFVCKETQTFDYRALHDATRVLIRALDRVIDINQYPLESARRSNMRHRPLGLGVQGLADVFCLTRMRFGSEESKVLNRRIAETMYFAAMTESHALAVAVDPLTAKPVGPYPSIDENGGAPIRHGIFQFDMWRDDFKDKSNPDGWKPDPVLGHDWETLRGQCMRDGVRNSLLIAPMPTASTSIILGNVESFEPYYGMIYVRSTKAGAFYQMCRPLVEDLKALGLWETAVHPTTGQSYIPMKEKIMAENGTIQNIGEIPDALKHIYVCVSDIKLKDLTEMARDRGVFTCQSMSLNTLFRNKDNMMEDMLAYMLFAEDLGLKTISYYTRTLQKQAALNFTGNSVKETACLSCSA